MPPVDVTPTSFTCRRKPGRRRLRPGAAEAIPDQPAAIEAGTAAIGESGGSGQSGARLQAATGDRDREKSEGLHQKKRDLQ